MGCPNAVAIGIRECDTEGTEAVGLDDAGRKDEEYKDYLSPTTIQIVCLEPVSKSLGWEVGEVFFRRT